MSKEISSVQPDEINRLSLYYPNLPQEIIKQIISRYDRDENYFITLIYDPNTGRDNELITDHYHIYHYFSRNPKNPENIAYNTQLKKILVSCFGWSEDSNT